jgi:hypothetical protein
MSDKEMARRISAYKQRLKGELNVADEEVQKL